MKTLVISKPIYDYILPLVEFPQDGDKFYIEKSINTISSIGTLIALIFAKYNVDVYFTGMVGEDSIGNKIKEILSENKVNISYIETSYTEKTCTSHKIYNSKTNKFTSIEENCLKTNLSKYKYDFIPEVIIMDDRDYQANLAAINNYLDALTIFIGEKYSKESSVYLNKCNYIITNLKFASDATGVVNDLNKTKNIINLFQKYIDLYNSNLIIRLDNFDILYCVEDEVRIIKNINKNISNKENLYYGILSFFLANKVDVENAIKLTNKVMLSSNNELDMLSNIPDIKIVSECYEEYKKNMEQNVSLNNSQNVVNTNNVSKNIETNVNVEQVDMNSNNASNVNQQDKIDDNQGNNGGNDVERL